jgi:transposase-like protein
MKYSSELIRKIMVELFNGESVSKLSKKHGISERTIRRWKDLIGDLKLVVGRHDPLNKKPKTKTKPHTDKIKKPPFINLSIAIEMRLPLDDF